MRTSFHQALHHWYTDNGRHTLPWRNTDDAYRIYLSEVMLQQTQVKTVLERFYEPFLSAFPTLKALADAPEDAVMKRWEGLGYYSRARNLHKAAKLAAPTLPSTYDELMALPGIGRNTAHAVLAFAYRKPYPVLEANVKRLVHRIFALKERDEKALWAHAEALLDTKNPFDYNQAMMDVGSTICLPKAPKCGECPASGICKGKDDPTAYPAPKAKKQTPTRHKTVIVLRDANGRYFLAPRQTRFLGGLYGFIEQEAGTKTLHFNGQEIPISQMQPMGSISQIYSHFKLCAEVYAYDLSSAMNDPEWFNLHEISALPLSGADKKALRLAN
jgi:A/G-specific adenine glycosylase